VSIESDLIDSLDSGRAESILKNTSDNPLTELLLRLTNEIIEDLRKQLLVPNSEGHKSYASGELAQSLKPTKLSPELIETYAAPHWKYINYGVNGIKVNRGAPTHGKAPKGNMTFYESIRKWIYDKGITPNEEGITREQLAGMIVNSVRMKGIEATHFFDKVVTQERKKEMATSISNLIGQSIKLIIKKPK
jgi:hypothetical protein